MVSWSIQLNPQSQLTERRRKSFSTGSVVTSLRVGISGASTALQKCGDSQGLSARCSPGVAHADAVVSVTARGASAAVADDN